MLMNEDMIFSAKELWLINQATELSVLHAELLRWTCCHPARTDVAVLHGCSA